MTNDIILSDGRVSRSHARLERGEKGSVLVDLGSSNGSRVNGTRVERADLKPNDLIIIGNTQLRYEISQPYEEISATVIDTALDLELTLDQEVLPMAINETKASRLVIFTPQKTWEVSLDELDSITIGRTEVNQVFIEHGKVSRQHAEVVRKGGVFVLRDLGSTNGTWYKGQAVTEMILQDGDSFRIGEAELVFKSGFSQQSLTMADESLAATTGRQPVVFVPGMMGSELWLGNERIWPNVKYLFKNSDLYQYPSKTPLDPRAIVDQVVIVPNLIKLDQYNRLGDYLTEELGYERGKDFFEFPYDWRQDVRISARQLGEMIETLALPQPIVLIGHSLGTMVSRYYIERLGGGKRVSRAVLMGGPHSGAVKGLTSMLVAPQILPFGIMGQKLQEVVMTFPASYQIIPTYACAVDQEGNKINFLEEESWVPEKYRHLLREARKFRQELGKRSNYSGVSIYGYGIKTIANVRLNRSPNGELKDISYTSEPSGDSSVLERSAVMPGTEIHPVQQYHGSLFVDNDVKMRMKLELTRIYNE
jgi:pSer/pThr/pTyr-binding forkhead associated (FHA) protein